MKLLTFAEWRQLGQFSGNVSTVETNAFLFVEGLVKLWDAALSLQTLQERLLETICLSQHFLLEAKLCERERHFREVCAQKFIAQLTVVQFSRNVQNGSRLLEMRLVLL